MNQELTLQTVNPDQDEPKVTDADVIGPVNLHEQLIPEGIKPFVDGAEEIIPSAIDDLPAGDYAMPLVESPQDRYSFDYDGVKKPKVLHVITTEAGKAIARESMSSEGEVDYTQNATTLMQSLGYVFEDIVSDYDGTISSQLTAIPTPETIKKSAGALGVNVELFPGKGIIPSKEYVGAFAEGKYPVATGSETYYAHDIQDDHITGLVLGGEPLRDALAEVSRSVLATEDEAAIGEMAGRIDTFTASLRSVVAYGTTIGEAYGMESGRGTLHSLGEGVGLNRETVENIIVAAQERAGSFDMGIKQLH